MAPIMNKYVSQKTISDQSQLGRISNGEVIEELQCLGSDGFTLPPVLQVGDSTLREEEKDPG